MLVVEIKDWAQNRSQEQREKEKQCHWQGEKDFGMPHDTAERGNVGRTELSPNREGEKSQPASFNSSSHLLPISGGTPWTAFLRWKHG